MPLGQSMLALVAGPKRLGRVMSIVGVPMLLAPVFGPLIGGAIIGAASWRWIFAVALAVTVLALVPAAVLPRSVATGGRPPWHPRSAARREA
jgi:MFS family permease